MLHGVLSSDSFTFRSEQRGGHDDNGEVDLCKLWHSLTTVGEVTPTMSPAEYRGYIQRVDVLSHAVAALMGETLRSDHHGEED
jgi:phage head maturation protease